MANFKHIVRIANTDLDGNKPIGHTLTKIKGIGPMLANSVCIVSEVGWNNKTGELADTDIKKLNDVVKSPLKFKIPEWMFNRRKDYQTGKSLHLVTSDLDFARDKDKRRMQKAKSYKGLRYHAGLPVRGQRTRSNFRHNKGKVMGVKRKK